MNFSRIKISLVEDNPVIALAIRERLSKQQEFQLLEICSSETEFQECVRRETPDIALVDLNLTELRSGLELLKWLAKEYPATRSLVITAVEDVATMLDCFVFKARGYILKSRLQFLVQSIHEVVEGRYVIPRELSENLVNEAVEMRREWLKNKSQAKFSRREQQGLELFEAGLTREKVASSLSISFYTVKRHIQKILKKDDASSIRNLLDKFTLALMTGLDLAL